MENENIKINVTAKDEPPLIEVKASVDPKLIPAESQLKSFIERIEQLEEEKKEISSDISEVYAAAKGQGFDPKVMRQVIRLRKMNPADRAETNYLLDEYKRILGLTD